MAQVTLEIGNRRYELACREGEQAHLQALGRIIDAKAIEATRAIGGVNEARQLLLAALLLADELQDARAGATPPSPPAVAAAQDDALAQTIGALADRLETVATKLEKPPATS